ANASLLNSSETFQWIVYQIHMPGKLLPLIEWGLILLPLLFHGILGVWIIRTGRSNSDQYGFTNNKRYTWQRYSGVIALVYLLVHVFHLHGWFHFEPYLTVAENLGGHKFRAYNASSTLASAMQFGYGIVALFYLVGVLACVYHLANGIWTAGITWGLWISPKAQERATKVCTAFGIVLGVLGVSALAAPLITDPVAAKAAEDRMYQANVEAGMIPDNPEKRSDGHDGEQGDADSSHQADATAHSSDAQQRAAIASPNKTTNETAVVDESESSAATVATAAVNSAT
ncbi:MAG: succinate dehydrogenase, partial [Planctomycetota bacterium]